MEGLGVIDESVDGCSGTPSRAGATKLWPGAAGTLAPLARAGQAAHDRRPLLAARISDKSRKAPDARVIPRVSPGSTYGVSGGPTP
jgi:hypothetical protein